ncbi:hypothetical protein L486_04784 [Kwoniella mangroviensis CBS 10435]|uniref:Uncharacterized protein n=1 Tax=Kwoniella mangroviensis CBS 10435 TaxID=1331196 RepID=A0A1B9IP21_9TREE|nr:hypothetical protein L486_04784 [Kwoniella mangroviensis CBS 10435]OCF76117.1 hypothetical protein I204_03416 [Kwoniella mangroviensis CBS 8886]
MLGEAVYSIAVEVPPGAALCSNRGRYFELADTGHRLRKTVEEVQNDLREIFVGIHLLAISGAAADPEHALLKIEVQRSKVVDLQSNRFTQKMMGLPTQQHDSLAKAGWRFDHQIFQNLATLEVS